MRQGSVGLWHGAASGGVEALGLGWLHAGIGGEASSGSEGAGEPLSGLHGDVKAQGDGGVQTPKSCQCWASLGTSAQTSWDIEG